MLPEPKSAVLLTLAAAKKAFRLLLLMGVENYYHTAMHYIKNYRSASGATALFINVNVVC